MHLGTLSPSVSRSCGKDRPYFPHCPNFLEFFDLHKYGQSPYYYRLFCFREILFSLHNVLILMNLWIIGGYKPW